MPADVVVDASVAAKIYFCEADSDMAEAALANSGLLVAPDLILAEMASVACRRVRQRIASFADGRRAVRGAPALLQEIVPNGLLCERAFELAERHGFSAYDGIYLALAERRSIRLLTADTKLARRARDNGLAALIWLLGE